MKAPDVDDLQPDDVLELRLFPLAASERPTDHDYPPPLPVPAPRTCDCPVIAHAMGLLGRALRKHGPERQELLIQVRDLIAPLATA